MSQIKIYWVQFKTCSAVGHSKLLFGSNKPGRKVLKLTHHDLADSGSSIVGAGIRENAIPEALYATIEDPPNASANGNAGSQPVYVLPSMTSPPPTYDVAIAKSWQVCAMN